MALAGKCAIFALCATAALAQHVVGARAGTVHFSVGAVTLDELALKVTPVSFPLLKEGQTVQTARGRVEILLAGGVFLRLAENSALRMVSTRLDDARVQLLNGTALVEVVETTKGDRIQIRAGDTVTEFKRMGLYRFELDPGVLRVFGGEAEVRADERTVRVGRGRAVPLRGSLSVSNFNPKQADDMQRWAGRRSFYLFASSPEARRHRTNWEATASGWSWNRDFQMRLFSPVVAGENQMKAARDALEKASFDRTQEQLRLQDEAARQQQQQAAQPQPQPQQPAPQAPAQK